MAKINLDNVRGITTNTVLADKVYENGAVLTVGGLIDGEYNMFAAKDVAGDKVYLVTTPEIDRTSNSDSIDHTNEKGSHMRVHQLERGDIFTVEQAVHGSVTAQKGQLIKGEGNAFVDATDVDAFAEVLEVETIGSDQRPAIAIRVV